MKKHRPFRSLVLVWFAGRSAAAFAATILYQGADFGGAPGAPRPNTDAAAASFKSALQFFSAIDFETLSVGNFATLTVAPGVTATLTGTAANGGISTLSSSTLGFNTTPGGAQFLHLSPLPNNALAAAVFNFAAPVDSFGAYITGLGSASGFLHVAFNDSTAQDLPLAGNAAGGVQFFGFTDFGASISAVSLEIRDTTASFDRIGIDDVALRATGAPEPAAGALLLAGLGGWLGARRRSAGQ